MTFVSDKGIIPLVCAEMFNRISSHKDPDVAYKVEVSYMEIYNEKVNDLLNPKNNRPGGLKVRNHPNTGPYISIKDLCFIYSLILER